MGVTGSAIYCHTVASQPVVTLGPHLHINNTVSPIHPVKTEKALKSIIYVSSGFWTSLQQVGHSKSRDVNNTV